MFGSPEPASLPCPECGVAIPLDGVDHVCDDDRRLWHQLFLVNAEVDHLDAELRAYLDSPEGRFELYYAERERLTNRGLASARTTRRR